MIIQFVVVAVLAFNFIGCSSKKVMEDNAAKFKDINEEFSQVVTVNELPVEKEPKPAPKEMAIAAKSKAGQAGSKNGLDKENLEKKKTVKSKEATSDGESPAILKESSKSVVEKKRLPEIEDSENFDGRKPVIDPFRPGEVVTLSVSYFNVKAGDVTMSVLPSKIVNNKRAYHFRVNVKSNSMFSVVYAVDNTAETFVDGTSLLPLTYTINMKESARLKEVRAFFDREKNLATYWEKTVKKDEDEKKKKVEWEIETYAQNVISSAFYLRNFTLKPGKKLAFYVADDGKNLIFRGEVLRDEILDTPVGKLKTSVVKVNFEMDDQFKQTGDNLIWLTQDDHKYIVRIESKVKIGTLVAKLKSIKRGREKNVFREGR